MDRGSKDVPMVTCKSRVECDATEGHVPEVDAANDIDSIDYKRPSGSRSAPPNNEKETCGTKKDSQTNKIKISPKSLNKRNRTLGRSYYGFKRTGNVYKPVKKDKRKVRPVPCQHKQQQSISNRSYLCETFSEDERQKVFETFWKFPSWDDKKAYLKGIVDLRKCRKRRKTTDANTAKKEFGYDCYLPDKSGKKQKVCRSFFLATLDIRHDRFNLWLKDSDKEGNCEKRKEPKVKSDSVLKWLEMLPKMPSYYCQNSTRRIYVESTFTSKVQMHDIYKEWCITNNLGHVERKRFCEILEDQKISLFNPRKDQCDTCAAYSEKNLSQEEYDLHIMKKQEAYDAKRAAINSSSDDTLVVTMGVQSVLLCPKLLESSQCYKQKLQLHNFSVYVIGKRDVHIYVWHECDGQATSNEFTTCIMHLIRQNLINYKKIILISDGYACQNKNPVLCSALADITKEISELEIEQIILEEGHTMMEVDGVHSTLETLFKAPIFLPEDYISRMRQARLKQPYIVNHVDYNFFLNYEDQKNNFISIRPGNKINDPTVDDIRGLLYQDGKVYYKLRHTDTWKLLPQRRQLVNMSVPKPLYTEERKIEKRKFDDLQSLKEFMPKNCHSFYDNLHCKKS